MVTQRENQKSPIKSGIKTHFNAFMRLSLRIKKAPSNRGLRLQIVQHGLHSFVNQKSPIKSGIKTHSFVSSVLTLFRIKKAPSNRGLRLKSGGLWPKLFMNQKSPIKSGIKTQNDHHRTLYYGHLLNQKSPIKSGIKTFSCGISGSILFESKKPHQIGD